MARLSREFYLRDTLEVARALLGKYLFRYLDGEWLIGRILETEAYIGRCDKACHAYGKRRTPRTSTLYLEGGHAYLYLIYGRYYCLNFVTEPEDEPAGVLIRALEPILGMERIWHLRFGDLPMTAYRRKNLLNGPGKVCQGLGLTRAENGLDLTQSQILYVSDELPGEFPGKRSGEISGERICTGPRIGIDYAEEARDFPWRFWLEPEKLTDKNKNQN